MKIGVYKGQATSWFLNNIMTNPESRLVAIDTFGGSPEYESHISFSNVEDSFYKNIKKTGRDDQVIVMKMYSSRALINLLHNMKMRFDIIFIDASHEAKDVLSDNVLAWELLKPGGILINDDYEWKALNKDYFRPKIAIDSFISSFKPELRIIYKGYQIIIQKLKEDEVERPVQEKIKNIIKYIKDLYDNSSFICKIDSCNSKFKIKFNITNKSAGKKNEKLINNVMKLRSNYRSKYFLNYLLLPGKNIYSNKDYANKKKYINKYDKLYINNQYNFHNSLIEFITKYVTKTDNVTILNRDYKITKANNPIYKLVQKIGKNNNYISIIAAYPNEVIKKNKTNIIINSNLLSDRIIQPNQP